MSGLFQTWDRLTTHGERGDGFVRLRLPGVRAAATYAAKSVPDELEAVLIEVNTQAIPAGADYPEARGFSVRADMLAPGHFGRTRLVLALTDGRYRDVFRSLADDVVTKLIVAEDEKDAIRLLIKRLSRWLSFLRRHGATGLSLEARRGLVGELFLMTNHLLERCGQDAAVGSWKGCRGANHDFQFPFGSIEVKTTCSNTPHAFHVSNIMQLDAPGQGQLFLYFVLVEETEAGDASLPGVVDALRDALDGTALEAFEDSLVEAGYLDSQREIYSSPRYSLRRERFFRVVGSFPRLRESSMPTGVEEVRYEVAVAACADFEVLSTDVLDALLETQEKPE